MPELPEVETIKRDLAEVLPGKVIRTVTVKHRKPINLSGSKFSQRLIGQAFVGVERTGKVLQLALSSGEWLVAHLKLTGQLVARRTDGGLVGGGHPIGVAIFPNQYTRLIFDCSHKVSLYFNDVRLFGWCHLLSEAGRQAVLAPLGPDALTAKPAPSHLHSYCLRYPQRSVKQMLLDQSWLAGIGNIYADEICFKSQLRPGRSLRALSLVDEQRLWLSISAILKSAVALRGTTFSNFVDGQGRPGGYYPQLKVYGRTDQPCQKCGTILMRLVVAQRGTHYCPRCQV